MKLKIKDKYFKEIKDGFKCIEIRDAHLTLINETTGEELQKKVIQVWINDKSRLSKEMQNSNMFDDDFQIYFKLA